MRYVFALTFCLVIVFNQAHAVEVPKATSTFYKEVNAHLGKSVADHEVQILESGQSALLKRVQMIESAKRSVKLEYYIFDCDESGRLIIQSLTKKLSDAKRENRPFDVQILLDNLAWSGSPGIDPFIVKKLRKLGFQIRYYNISTKMNPFRHNHRNHRKIFIVDDEEAVIGGRNMADDYFDLNKSYNFIDLDIWVKGAIVNSVAKSFNEYWSDGLTQEAPAPVKPTKSYWLAFTSAARKKIDEEYEKSLQGYKWLRKKAPECLAPNDELRKKLDEVAISELAENPVVKVNKVTFVSDFPGYSPGDRQVAKVYASFLKKAQTEVYMENYTLLPDGKINDVLATLQKRNVKTVLLTNGFQTKSDIVLYAFSHPYQVDLVKRGFEIFGVTGKPIENQTLINAEGPKVPWSIHSKAATVDGKHVWVGSNNMDPRSQSYNSESAIAVYDSPELAAQVKKIINRRLKSAVQLKPDGTYSDGLELFSNYTKEEIELQNYHLKYRVLYEPLY